MRGRDEGITWLWCKVLFMSPFSKQGHVLQLPDMAPGSSPLLLWLWLRRSPGPAEPPLLEPSLHGECSIFSPVLEDRRILALVLGLGAQLGGPV